MRYFFGLIWFIVLYFLVSILASIIIIAFLHFSGSIDLSNPPSGDGYAFGREIGKASSPIAFVVALIAAIIGTIKQKLPGTKSQVVNRHSKTDFEHRL